MLFQDSVQRFIDGSADDLVKHVIKSYELVKQFKTKLPTEVFQMEGFSGKMTRMFYNHLLSYEDARYLEIGTFKGSSTCAALHKNVNAKATCIDNWSQFNGPKDEFIANIKAFTNVDNITVIEQDCWTVDAAKLPKHNFYLYDGDHTFEAQYRAITHFVDAMDDCFVLVVDDWNWKEVQDGTMKGILDCNLELVYKKEILSNPHGQHVLQTLGVEQWWNGMLVAVLKKN